MSDGLHERLVERQATEELKRKADKALRRDLYTQEDLDYALRHGRDLYEAVRFE